MYTIMPIMVGIRTITDMDIMDLTDMVSAITMYTHLQKELFLLT